MAEVDTFDLKVRSFLHFCRAEKGLSVNTLEAYRRDLGGLGQWLVRPGEKRSFARHIARRFAAISRSITAT